MTLAEMAFGGGLGFSVDLESVRRTLSPGTALAAEGASRSVVEIRESDVSHWERAVRGLPNRRFGSVRGTDGELRSGCRSACDRPAGTPLQRWRNGLGLPG